MSSQVSQTTSAESTSSVRATTLQSSAAMSQSIMTEMGRILPALEVSMTHSVAEQMEKSRTAIESAVINSSVDLKLALDAYAKQHMIMIASVFHGNPAFRNQNSQSPFLELANCKSSLRRSRRGQRTQGCGLANQMPSSCQCLPDIGHTSSSLSLDTWGIQKTSEDFIIHKRGCSLWYQSQRLSIFSIDFHLFHTLRIFGSLSIRSSPYTSIFGWSISQNITYKAVVSENAPPFEILKRYLNFGKPVSQKDVMNCSRDLRAVFQSGRGSPNDTLCDGTTLIDVSHLTYRKDQLCPSVC